MSEIFANLLPIALSGGVKWDIGIHDVKEHAEVLDVSITTNNGDAFGLVTYASIVLNTYAVRGKICKRNHDKYGTRARIYLHASNTLQDSGEDDLSGRLDGPDEANDDEVTICLMLGESRPSEYSSLWFLLLSNSQRESGAYIRVGCILLWSRPAHQIQKMLQTFLEGPKRTFVVV